jgi:exopolysaccharide biosynthesis protein
LSLTTLKSRNTGGATWVQVHSKGRGEKFQNISTANIKIYKAHNPQVLKTATSKHPALAILPDVMAQYPDALIMNASGFNIKTGDITGFQINNGALFTNWEKINGHTKPLSSIKMVL